MIIVWFISYAFYFFLQSYIARPADHRHRPVLGDDPQHLRERSAVQRLSRACTRRCRRSSRSTGGASTGASASRRRSGRRSSSRRRCSSSSTISPTSVGGLVLAGVTSWLVMRATRARRARDAARCGTMRSTDQHTTHRRARTWHQRLRHLRAPPTSCPAAPPPDRSSTPRHTLVRGRHRGSGLSLHHGVPTCLTIFAVSPRSGGTAHSKRRSLTPPPATACAASLSASTDAWSPS